MGLSELKKFLRFTLRIRFAALWFAVAFIGFIEAYILLPFGVAAFVGAVFLTAFTVWVLRRSGYGNRSRRLQIAKFDESSPLDRSLRQGPRSHREASREHDGEL
jgi:hypothetical protein